MFEEINQLDLAIEEALEKSTTNAKAHIAAATMSQGDYDKHADALAHHAGAIEYYRNKPEVKKALEALNNLIPVREYVNKPLKMENTVAPQITKEDLNAEHPLLKGREDIPQEVDRINKDLKTAHGLVQHPDVKALSSHSKRFLAHMGSMLEWHNLQKKGEGTHHQFSGKVEGPELQGNFEDSKYRGHSTPSAADRTKFRTQSITKGSGSRWHPGLPELTSLEESVGHPSNGKPKELYPFGEIKINGEKLKPKEFKDTPPDEIHEQDYNTALPSTYNIKKPSGETGKAMGVYMGTKTMGANLEGMKRAGIVESPKPEEVKKSTSPVCCYFPNVTGAHYILAKNLLGVLNPFSEMDDESFGDYVATSLMNPEANVSSCAAILAEANGRLEKAKKDNAHHPRLAIPDRDRRKGIEDVLSGKVKPLPLSEASERTAKDKEKRSELEDFGYEKGKERKRSPYAVPKDVFTDETYSKIDPKKYQEYVNGDMTDRDLRNEHATYSEVVKHNPEAQKRHNAYIEMERQSARENLKRGGQSDEQPTTPVKDHKATLAQAGKDLQSGKITPDEFAMITADSAQKRAESSTHKAGAKTLTPEEAAVKEKDPEYQPIRLGAAGKAVAESEKEMTDIARGKAAPPAITDAQEGIPSEEGEAATDEPEKDYTAAQAKELTQQRGEGEDKPSASVETVRSPADLISSHPGFASYLRFKEHMLSHYKNPAVRAYMEQKINQHENDPNMDSNKLAAVYHVLHRVRENAMRTGKTPDVRGMMTPEEKSRFQEVKAAKTPEGTPTPKMSEVPAVVPDISEAAPREDVKPKTIRRPAKQ